MNSQPELRDIRIRGSADVQRVISERDLPHDASQSCSPGSVHLSRTLDKSRLKPVRRISGKAGRSDERFPQRVLHDCVMDDASESVHGVSVKSRHADFTNVALNIALNLTSRLG
jgi:hypothetical protein